MKKKYLTHKEKGGFQVPENYFQEFGARVFSKLEIENQEPTKVFEQEPLAPGFEVPQNYFENFEAKLPNSTPKVIPLFDKKKWAYAASIAAMFLLAFSIFNEASEPTDSFSTIGYNSIEKYIENGQIDFSSSEMENLLSEEASLSELEFDKLNEADLFDYLMNNSTEISLINQ